MPNQLWNWVDFLSSEIGREGNSYRTLLGWAGSSIVAIAILLWISLGTLESVGFETPWPILFALGFLGFLVASTFTSIYPGGFSGLADRLRGFGYTSEFDEFPPKVALDFLSKNHRVLRNESIKRATAEVVSVLLLIAIAVASPVPAPGQALIWSLIALRLGVYLATIASVVVFLTPEVLARVVSQFTDYGRLLETNPRVSRIIVKLALLGEIASKGVSILFYGLQIAAAGLLVLLIGSPTFEVLRLLFLAVVIAVLTGFVWALWTKSKDPAYVVQEYASLREDILRGDVHMRSVVQEFVQSRRNIDEQMMEPFEIPESLWESAYGVKPKRLESDDHS